VRVTVLGKSPAWQDADGACSGYLVQGREATVLLDCGNGVFGKLRRHADHAAVDAVVVSHLHADHFFDLVPFAYALTYATEGRSGPPRLLLPPGGRELVRRVVGVWGGEGVLEQAFAVEEYAPGAEARLGDLLLRFRAVPHFLPTCAIDVDDGAGRLTYGADHGPSDTVVDLARETDLLLLEATLPEPDPAPAGERGHLTAREAGEHAARAGARRLVLTHLSDLTDVERAATEARAAFGGPVEVAREGAVYTV
jgi:ribonuclease BN (tRNA processing enzyme)